MAHETAGMPPTASAHDDTSGDNIQYACYPDLKDKVVLLTGIGQAGDQSMWGNGAATARVLAKQGAKIFGCDLYLEAAEYTAKRLRAEGAEVTVIAADVTKDDSVKALVDACIAKYGRIDILVK